jgi:excisionase family DNA binding protein
MLLTYGEAAKRCSVSKDTFRRIVDRGLIARIMVAPNSPRIAEPDLDAYLERQRQELSPVVVTTPSAGKKRGRGRPRKDGRPVGAPKRGRPRKSVEKTAAAAARAL